MDFRIQTWIDFENPTAWATRKTLLTFENGDFMAIPDEPDATSL